MIVRVYIVFALLFFIYSATFAQDSWNLKRAVEYALANNISVKQADIQAKQIADLNLKQSKLMQVPTANISGNAGVNAGRSIDPTTNLFTNTQLFSTGFSLTSAVTIFNFFSLRRNVEANKFDNAAAEANYEKIKNDIALTIATAYLQVLVSYEQQEESS